MAGTARGSPPHRSRCGPRQRPPAARHRARSRRPGCAATTQWTNPPASGSCITSASSAVPSGVPDHDERQLVVRAIAGELGWDRLAVGEGRAGQHEGHGWCLRCGWIGGWHRRGSRRRSDCSDRRVAAVTGRRSRLGSRSRDRAASGCRSGGSRRSERRRGSWRGATGEDGQGEERDQGLHDDRC